jgi:hypothetical protein
MSKKKTPPVDRAVATVKQKMVSDAQKVSVTAQVVQGMQKSPNWATATAVQAAVKSWSDEASALAANAASISALRSQLKAALWKQASTRRDWAVAKSTVMVSVTSFCGGSADMVASFTLDVVSRARIGALGAPLDLTVKTGTVLGEVLTRWTKGVADHGFLLQHAADSATPATYSAAIPCTKARATLGGLTPGAPVSCRVAAIDPTSSTGMSPWSAWTIGKRGEPPCVSERG